MSKRNVISSEATNQTTTSIRNLKIIYKTNDNYQLMNCKATNFYGKFSIYKINRNLKEPIQNDMDSTDKDYIGIQMAIYQYINFHPPRSYK